MLKNITSYLFIAAILALAGLACSNVATGNEHTIGKPELFPLNERQRERLVEVIENYRFPYSEEDNLLLIPKPKANFKNHFDTRPKHGIRWSMDYAVALMDSGVEEYRLRALDIIREVLKYQDRDPESKDYGLFPDFKEMPLDKMRRPDKNSADFLAVGLIQIRFPHADRLPEDLKQQMDESIIHSSNSIVARNVPVSYTNVAVMSTLVTLVAGQAYDKPDILDFGSKKLDQFVEQVRQEGTFNEYNSPNYIVLSINSLRRIMNYITAPELLAKIDEVYEAMWRHFAVRYHQPTGQWSGPHSRCYQEFLPPDYQSWIKSALTGELIYTPNPSRAGAVFEHRVLNHVPDSLRHYFTTAGEAREVVETFAPPRYPDMMPIVGTTYLSPWLSLGSVNYGDMWNQRRNLQAYWGNQRQPAYMRTRFLKDDYDFSAVLFYGAQQETDVIAAMNFSTNGGDRHVSQDPIRSGKFAAKDLRVRFEFGGSARDIEITLPEDLSEPVTLQDENVAIKIVAPLALLGDLNAHWETGKDGKTAWLDLVFYEGAKIVFDLNEMGDCGLAFGLEFNPVGESELSEDSWGIEDVAATVEDGRLNLQWDELYLDVTTVPGLKYKNQALLRLEE